jgi:hypothetical protein
VLVLDSAAPPPVGVTANVQLAADHQRQEPLAQRGVAAGAAAVDVRTGVDVGGVVVAAATRAERARQQQPQPEVPNNNSTRLESLRLSHR